MSKSVELLADAEDRERINDRGGPEDKRRQSLNGSRQKSRSATELRNDGGSGGGNNVDSTKSSPSRRTETPDSGVIQHHHHHRYASVAQRTQTFFATLKSRWTRSRSRERKKRGEGGAASGKDSQDRSTGVESDYAADYSSDHSKSSSATQSPARHYLNHPESPLARVRRDKGGAREDSPGRFSDGSSKGSLGVQVGGHQKETTTGGQEELRGASLDGEPSMAVDESARRRELALRQHAFFQLRLHIRRGTNLVAMDRCGASDPYVKIKCAGRLLHKSRTVHRDLNPVWDESVTLPIEDPFQPLNIKVFDYDWGLQDDFMGAAFLDLTQLELGHLQDVTLELKDPGRPKQHLGEIYLSATLWPRNQQEKEQTKEEDAKEKHVYTVEFSKDSDHAILRQGSKRSSVSAKRDKWNQAIGAYLEKNPKMKGKIEAIEAIRNSLEKRVDVVERIVEDRVERILEDNVGKRTWLQPIDAWIAERCMSKINSTRGYESDGEVKASTSMEEGINLDAATLLEIKHGSKVVEQLKRLRRRSESRDESKEEPVVVVGEEEFSEFPPVDLELTTATSMIELNDVKRQDFMDKIKDGFKEKMEDLHKYFQRTSRLADVNRRLKSQIWSSVVTIVLVEAKNLLPMDIDGLSDPYVKFRLGSEKYKSKVANKTLNPAWLEQFDLHLYEDPYLGQELEVTVWDRDKSHQDDLMGRATIDLATLERETTHRIWKDLEDGAGMIYLLLTISGTTASETISDLAAHEENAIELQKLYQRYSFVNTLKRPRDVGHLIVKVYRAQGLAAADLGGKSDPFCVLELINARLQTQTEYKTLTPSWQKIFTFNVKDINSVLEVTVYDEDRDHKVEFLGKVAIPLLKIRNGEKRWYALKDKKLRGRAKGNSPQILLELTVIWNVMRACIRTVNPKEKKYMEPEIKFKRQVFLRNVMRLKAIILIFIDMGKYMQSCWEWESKPRSLAALIIFVLGCWYFEPWMIPLVAFLILLKYYLVAVVTGAPLAHQTTMHLQDGEGGTDDCPPTPGEDDDDEDDKDKEEKKSLKERLQAIQEVTQTVQNSIGYIASLGERVKNLFNFTVPYLSYLAMFLVAIVVAVLYLIPIRYLILGWGVNKFSRKIFRPHSVPNNEVLDLLSRVPDDEELINFRELKPVPTADCEKSTAAAASQSGGTTSRRELRKRQHKGA